MNQAEYRKTLVQHKRKQRDKLLKDIELVAILGIMNIVIPLLMIAVYIAQAGPI